MATQRPDRPITRWMAYTKIPVSSGNLEPSGRKKCTVSSTASTVNSTAPRTCDHMKDDDLELDSGEVDVA